MVLSVLVPTPAHGHGWECHTNRAQEREPRPPLAGARGQIEQRARVAPPFDERNPACSPRRYPAGPCRAIRTSPTPSMSGSTLVLLRRPSPAPNLSEDTLPLKPGSATSSTARAPSPARASRRQRAVPRSVGRRAARAVGLRLRPGRARAHQRRLFNGPGRSGSPTTCSSGGSPRADTLAFPKRTTDSWVMSGRCREPPTHASRKGGQCGRGDARDPLRAERRGQRRVPDHRLGPGRRDRHRFSLSDPASARGPAAVRAAHRAARDVGARHQRPTSAGIRPVRS